MVIRFRVGTNLPTQHLNLYVSLVLPLPKSYRDAFNDPNWQNTMCDEHNALIRNQTWTLMPRPTDTNIVRCMWLFRHKYLADGTLSRYKARLVANVMLLLDIGRNAFLHGDLSETFYMHQPSGFQDPVHPDYVCLLQRSLYGLKQAPRAWFQRFASYITRVGFHHSRCDSSLFIYRQGTYTSYLLLYVDDIVLTASSETLLQDVLISVYFLWSTTGLYSHDPWKPHFSAIKRILRYVRGTLDHALQLFSSFTTSLVGYSDADWAGCLTTRRSTSGYCVFLGNNLLNWSSKHQLTLSRSSAEAEYHGIANAVAETCWLRNLLRELHTPLSSATLVYCDNVSAVYLSSNPVQH
ncbi:ribonuclease H-like domain-containing protein [Tanacetum coccineum]